MSILTQVIIIPTFPPKAIPLSMLFLPTGLGAGGFQMIKISIQVKLLSNIKSKNECLKDLLLNKLYLAGDTFGKLTANREGIQKL